MADNKQRNWDKAYAEISKNTRLIFEKAMSKMLKDFGEVKEIEALIKKRDKQQSQALVEAVQEIATTLKDQKSTISKRREALSNGLISIGNLSMAGLFFWTSVWWD